MADNFTPEDVAALTTPFGPREHEFKGGFAYVSEEAVTNRLDAVAPGDWTLEVIRFEIRRDSAEEFAVCHVRLTIKGVWRDGIGMQTYNRTGKDIFATELEKGAATDALRRAARLFGVGRYLLGIPKGVKDMASLTNWLQSLNGTSAPENGGKSALDNLKGAELPGTEAPAKPKGMKRQSEQPSGKNARWTRIMAAGGKMPHYKGVTEHVAETYRLLVTQGVFTDDTPADSVIGYLSAYGQYRDQGLTSEAAIQTLRENEPF